MLVSYKMHYNKMKEAYCMTTGRDTTVGFLARVIVIGPALGLNLLG
jgi:hypothetical protein